MSAERRRLGILLAIAALVAGTWFWPKSGSDPAAAGPGAERSPRGRGGSKELDPADIKDFVDPLPGKLESGKVVRNIFRFYVRPTPAPRPVPPLPTPFPGQGQAGFVGPAQPTPIPPPTPIIPPPIPYTAVGIFGPRERPIVTFEDNGRLINAREGDTLDGRFIVRKVNRESVDFAFVGLPNDITRRLAVAGAEGGR